MKKFIIIIKRPKKNIFIIQPLHNFGQVSSELNRNILPTGGRQQNDPAEDAEGTREDRGGQSEVGSHRLGQVSRGGRGSGGNHVSVPHIVRHTNPPRPPGSLQETGVSHEKHSSNNH